MTLLIPAIFSRSSINKWNFNFEDSNLQYEKQIAVNIFRVATHIITQMAWDMASLSSTLSITPINEYYQV